jgi:hypothetical protein
MSKSDSPDAMIPDAAGSTVGDYFETLAWLGRSGHLDIRLLWNSIGHSARIWWTVLEPFIRAPPSRNWHQHLHGLGVARRKIRRAKSPSR